MHISLGDFLAAFVPIFVAVDPLGLIPVFIFLTESYSQHEKNKTIAASLLTALGVAVGFMFVGKWVLALLGITVADFLIAGGLLLFALSMSDLLSPEPRQLRAKAALAGVVPLGMPLMAGPAVFTTTLIVTSAHGIGLTLISLVLNILIAGMLLFASRYLIRLFGINTGLKAISKLTSILLSAYAIMMVRRGVLEILGTFLVR